MNRHRRRPLKLHLRAAPKQKVAFRSSPKLSLKRVLPGALLALVMVAALSFAAVAFLKNVRMKHQGNATVASPSATVSPLLAGTVDPVPTSVASPRVPLVSATPAFSPSATPIVRPTALARDVAPQEEKTPSKGARKSAEQKRREAERKRTRLEAQHKNHQISEEAYKQGQQEYQAEMAKYRNVVGGGHSPNQSQ